MPDQLHDGLIALLGTAVGASVFAVGFVSIRHHAALSHARRHALSVPPDAPEELLAVEREYLKRLSDDAATWVVLVAITVLLAIVLVAIGLAMHHGIGTEGYLTLVGFGLVEVVVVAVGYGDHWTARQRIVGTLADEQDYGRRRGAASSSMRSEA